MKTLEGKIALVTGASKGIGAEIAKELASQGAKTIVNYRTDKQGAESVVNSIEQEGGNAIAIQADVAKQAEVKGLFTQIVEKVGKPDVIVNNAGVYTFEPVEVVTEKEFHRQFDSNVLGVILTIQEALKYFEKGSNIINVGSVASVMPTPASIVYSATKSAVDSITSTLAKELGPKGIRINAILPGPTQTEGNPVEGTEMENYIVSNTPLGRIGQPKDMSSLVAFLASDKAGWITGQKIVVSGGFQ